MAFYAGILIAGALLLPAVMVVGSFPVTLKLDRAIPRNHTVELRELVARDKVRHGRILQSSNGVVDFPVQGTFDPFVVG